MQEYIFLNFFRLAIERERYRDRCPRQKAVLNQRKNQMAKKSKTAYIITSTIIKQTKNLTIEDFV